MNDEESWTPLGLATTDRGARSEAVMEDSEVVEFVTEERRERADGFVEVEHTFTAGVFERDDGLVEVDPVPEEVQVETWGAIIDVSASSIDDGQYYWCSNSVDIAPGKFVTLQPVDEVAE